MLELKNISFSYGKEKELLHNFNFMLSAGERIGLIGPNGSGKTTIFKIIMGLLQPQAGEIIIFSQPRKNKQDFLEVRQNIGYLFQDPDNQLFCPTVVEDIAFGPLNLGKTKQEALAIADTKLQLVGMAGYQNKITYNLSQGEKKIISFAAVLAMEPRLLLLDEPFASLDNITVERMIAILNTIQQPYLIVSHNKNLLEKVIDKSYQVSDLCS
ncbi:energy-coupling factor ABC transporter ATP-binding protein [Halanaerobium salsuginis]|uniref:Cobalt/nickel transport system ATP-binding protein n=1 Tax=Halanaerobium salsuginis TaxID=29563 RepID=A0A1I4L8Y2_9FIRM|nr:energy-coupling factor ABC transporter ATP-binding protein [Halanaerobium salsuginis]SFL87326.1 cobalt/nickel transport system ATP-binding protein [Halanaerobium salsuginis]